MIRDVTETVRKSATLDEINDAYKSLIDEITSQTHERIRS